MTTREAAFAAVLADPDSDPARMALAKILSAAGDPQGELIAAQTEAVNELRKYGPTPDWKRLTARANELTAKLGYDIATQVRPLADHPIILRGLVEGVTLAASKFLSIAPQLYKVAPIRQVILVDTGAAIKDIAASPYLDQLVSINFYNRSKSAGIGDAGARALAGSPHVRKLKRLGLNNNDIGADGVDAIAGSKNLANLIYVELGGNRVPSPVEGYGVDGASGLVVREGAHLEASGAALEAKYGRIEWLHAPSELTRYPPLDDDF
ncbi:MAG: hypothetical protein QM831_41390 [Kofleriaceae bacterium]